MAKPPSKKCKTSDLALELQNNRQETAESIMKFKFNKERVQILSELDEIQPNVKGVAYWMFRDVRVQDNWAMLFAQKIALKNQLPLHVCYCMCFKFATPTLRHYSFLLEALKEIEYDCKALNINFHLLHGEPNTMITDFVKKYKMGLVVTDFFPLRLPLFWVQDLKKKLPKNVAFCQVDAHNIVPCWIASQKIEYWAHTIRKKINSKLNEFLTEFPPVIKHPYTTNQKFYANKWNTVKCNGLIDTSVDKVSWAHPGYLAGIVELDCFLMNRLKDYGNQRNNPLGDGLSNLSPWLNFV